MRARCIKRKIMIIKEMKEIRFAKLLMDVFLNSAMIVFSPESVSNRIKPSIDE